MSTRRIVRPWAGVIAATAVAGMCLAQPVTPLLPTPPSPTPAPAAPGAPAESPPPVLAGPSVPDAARKPTLVELDFPGRVRRLDVAPEAAAVHLMTLDDATREAVDRILAARTRGIDDFAASNLDLLTKLGTADATGDKLDQLLLAAEAVRQLAPVWRKGTLRSQIEAVLSESDQQVFASLLDEYWDAIVKEQQAPAQNDVVRNTGEHARRTQPQPKRSAKSRFEILAGERLASFGKEIERSVQRMLYSGDLLFRLIDKGMTLTDAQRGSIRVTCAEYAERTRGDASEAQNLELFVRLAGVLDMRQQQQLAALLRGLKDGAAARRDKAASLATSPSPGTTKSHAEMK